MEGLKGMRSDPAEMLAILRKKYTGKDGEGMLMWSLKEVVGNTELTSYYDISTYRIPVIGKIDIGKIHSAISKKFPAKFTNFGGYTTCGEVKDNGDGTVNVKMYYHIGE